MEMGRAMAADNGGDLTEDLALLTAAARAAGALAVTFTGRETRRWDKPDDAGPVTECDLAVNALLEEKLRSARPAYGWLSEESTDGAERLRTERVFVIDPLDGTRNFIEGGRTWAHSLAIVENGKPVAGVVFLPLLDRIYVAARGHGAHRNDVPIRASRREGPEGATLLAARPAMRPNLWKGGEVPGVERVYRPSLAYRLSLVAEGRYDSMLTLRDSWEWDIAAGAVIMSEAGAKASDRNGADLRFNNPHPQVPGVVAGAPGLQRALQSALKQN